MARKAAKTYPIDQCALYKLRSKRRLASILGVALADLERITDKPPKDKYNIFSIHPAGRKSRIVEQPKGDLAKIHQRIFGLIRNLNAPSYLYSGVRGKSYIDNAARHRGAHNVAKIDIKSFYPSTKSYHVYGFYKHEMKCSPDVAAILTKLSICEDHIPTGSCLSQILAFYSHVNMFNAIHDYAESQGVTMTCYVDDITFSGENVSKRFLFTIKKLIHNRDLGYHKEQFYKSNEAKVITGVVVVDDEIKVRNRTHKVIHDEIQATLTTEKIRSLVGKCNAAAQIDGIFIPVSKYARRLLSRT